MFGLSKLETSNISILSVNKLMSKVKIICLEKEDNYKKKKRKIKRCINYSKSFTDDSFGKVWL